MVVSFLRGVNIGANNKIKMSVLKSIYTKLGYVHIQTCLNTGNIVFKSFRNKSSALLEKEIKNMIKHEAGLDIEVIIRTKSELKHIIENYPFIDEKDKNRYVTMFKKENRIDISEQIDKYKKENDQYLIIPKEIYLYLPNGYSRTKLNNSFLEKKTGVTATTRNMNTLTKVLSIMD